MNLEVGELYSIYNQGNNLQRLFLTPGNYPYFLRGIQRYLLPHCDILSYCLMPNHFHLLVHANEKSVVLIEDGSFPRQQFSQGIKQLLSSYTQGVNKQTKRTGSLFRQKTKAIHLFNKDVLPEMVFHKIHQNPMNAGLVTKMEDWPYSSFSEYLNGNGFCNQSLAREILKIDFNLFYQASYNHIQLV